MNFEHEEQQSVFQSDLHVSAVSKEFLLSLCKWGRFISIIGIVMIVLFDLLFILGGGIFSQLNPMPSSPVNFGGSAFIVLAVIMTVFYFFPIYFLFTSTKKIKKGILENSQFDLDEGFEKLKSLFKFWGIVIVIYLCFFAISMTGPLIMVLTR